MFHTRDSDGSTKSTHDHLLVTNTTNLNLPVEFHTQTSDQSSVTALNHLRLTDIWGRIPCIATKENFMIEMQEWLISSLSLSRHLHADNHRLAITYMLTCQP